MTIEITAPGGSDAALRDALHQLMTFMGARARITTSDTGVDIATAETAIGFDEAQFDTDGFWSAGTPTRLTIPHSLGIQYVRLAAWATTSSSTGDTWAAASIWHYSEAGATQFVYGQRFFEHGNTGWMCNVATGPVKVEDGHYFEFMLREESDTSITISACFLSLEVIGRVFATD